MRRGGTERADAAARRSAGPVKNRIKIRRGNGAGGDRRMLLSGPDGIFHEGNAGRRQGRERGEERSDTKESASAGTGTTTTTRFSAGWFAGCASARIRSIIQSELRGSEENIG
nr:unnamed protein product [Callosobruchus chinensis]